jgi:hypothetical protein
LDWRQAAPVRGNRESCAPKARITLWENGASIVELGVVSKAQAVKPFAKIAAANSVEMSLGSFTNASASTRRTSA